MADDEKPQGEPSMPAQTKRIVELRDKGCTNQQIAERLGVTKRTVERAFAYVRKINGMDP